MPAGGEAGRAARSGYSVSAGRAGPGRAGRTRGLLDADSAPRFAAISSTAGSVRDRGEPVGAQPAPLPLPRCRRQGKSPAFPQAGPCPASCSQGPCCWEPPSCSQVRHRWYALPQSDPVLRRALRDGPPVMSLVGCASRAPDRSRHTPLVGWSRRPPASPSPFSFEQGRGSDPCFPGSGEAPHPRAVVMLRIPIGVPGEQLPGRSGGAEPWCFSSRKAVVAWRPASPGHRAPPYIIGSCPNRCIMEREHVLVPGHASFLRILFSSVPVLPVKRKSCIFSSQKSRSCCLPPEQVGGAPAALRAGLAAGSYWRVGRSRSPVPASRIDGDVSLQI